MRTAYLFLFLLLAAPAIALTNSSIIYYYSFDNDTYNGTDWEEKLLKYNASNLGVTVDSSPTCFIGECIKGGAGDYVYPDQAIMKLSTDYDFGISVWANFSSVSATQSLVSNQPYTVYIRMYDDYDAAPVAGRLTVYYAYGGGDIVRLEAHGLTTGQYYHIVVNQEEGNQTLYVDGVLVNSSTNGYSSSLTEAVVIGKKQGASANYFTGNLDELAIINNSIFTADNVTELYNGGAGLAWPFIPGNSPPTVVNNLPYNEDHTRGNGDGTLNFSANITTAKASANCSLYVNSTGQTPFNVSWLAGAVNGTINFTNVALNETRYQWFVMCEDANGQTNSTTTAVIHDNTKPDWVFNGGNFFGQNNLTVINPLYDGETGLLNVSIQDNYVFAYNITIRNSTGGVFWSKQQTAINSSNENITETINFSTWKGGSGTVYNITLFGEDDHTIGYIDPFPYTTEAQSITYDTPTAGITITSTRADGGVFTTEKEPDRYTFAYNPVNTTATWTFRLESTEPLYYRGGLYPFPSFVTGKQWVDFNTGHPATIYEVKKEDDYTYEIEIETEDETGEVFFESLGGLNSANESFSFTLLRRPAQASNLSDTAAGDTWIILNWTTDAAANGTRLYHGNQTVIATYNNTVTSHNVSGLASSTQYRFIAQSFYNTTLDGEVFNLSTSGENNITAWTTGNGSILVNVYDEDTNTLITESITVTATGNASEDTVTTTTGTANFGSLNNGTYTVSAYGANYTQRTSNFTVVGGFGTLNIYLVRDADLVTFTFLDDDVRTQTLPGALVYMYRFINANRTLVEVRESDISGKSRFSYSDGARYDFEVSLTGYNFKNFTLNPVLFSTYDVILTKNLTEQEEQYTSVNVHFSPLEYFGGGSQNNFTISFSSPAGVLTSYAYSLITPDGSYANSGTSPGGDLFANSFLINTTADWQTVNLSYSYDTTIGPNRTFSQTFYINPTRNDSTIIGNRDATYGLGSLERALIGTIIIIVVGGIALILAGGMASGVVSMLLMGTFAFIGFWSWWAVLPSLLVAMLLIGGSRQ